MLNLNAYFHRIGYRDSPAVNVATLTELHRLHLLAIPYENLDVQLQRSVGLEIDAIFEKLVVQRRGGWCYEMNGLLAWALEEIGFPLTRMAAGVLRETRGDAALGNHLALWVHLGEGYLADVGFGDGALEPLELRTGSFRQGALDFRLEQVEDGWWRFHNHAQGGAPSFDFHLSEGDRALLRRQCEMLQNSPQSPFVQVAVVQRHLPEGLAILRGRVLKLLDGVEWYRREIRDRDDYVDTLRGVFALEPPQPDDLWEKVLLQHEAHLRAASTVAAVNVS